MQTWQKVAIMTLITLAIGGIYLFTVFEHRRNPGVNPNASSTPPETMDDVAPVRSMFMTSFDDAVKLQNTSVWMKNGYSMPYYPYESGHIAFAKSVGVLPAAHRLDVKKIIKAEAPDNVDDGIDHGSRQVFAIFTLPGKQDLYATVIGVIGGGQEQYFCDILFYYDDPHGIYDFWPKNVWAAIDAHQVLPGMSELQTQMSIGHNQHTQDSSQGNRTITYDQAGNQWTVTFVNNKATTIKTGAAAAH